MYHIGMYHMRRGSTEQEKGGGRGQSATSRIWRTGICMSDQPKHGYITEGAASYVIVVLGSGSVGVDLTDQALVLSPRCGLAPFAHTRDSLSVTSLSPHCTYRLWLETLYSLNSASTFWILRHASR